MLGNGEQTQLASLKSNKVVENVHMRKNDIIVATNTRES